MSIRSTPTELSTVFGENETVKLTVSPAPIVAGSGGAFDIEKIGVADGGADEPAVVVALTLMLLTDPTAVPLLVIWKTRVDVPPTETGGKITLPLFCTVVVMPPAT